MILVLGLSLKLISGFLEGRLAQHPVPTESKKSCYKAYTTFSLRETAKHLFGKIEQN